MTVACEMRNESDELMSDPQTTQTPQGHLGEVTQQSRYLRHAWTDPRWQERDGGERGGIQREEGSFAMTRPQNKGLQA